MFKNFLKIAIRNLWKNKSFSSINITGLALGIASCLLILSYVNDEWNYDSFHEKGNQIYRITSFESEDGIERNIANSYYPLAPILEATFPEKSKIVRYFPKSLSVKNVTSNEIVQEEQFYFADSLFFDLFSFDFISGQKRNALVASNSVVLTEATAKRYFGNENPIGKSLILEGKADFFVTGIVENPPANSSIQFDFLAPMNGVPAVLGRYYFHPNGAWYYPPVYTFAEVPDEAFVADWENYQPKWKENYLPEHIRNRHVLGLQPIQNMHFEALENDLAAAVKPSFLWILTGIAFLILGIACINYINLSLTRLVKRFPEIGMRKVLGAMNRNILQQMLAEACLYVGVSLIIGIGLVQLALPYFNQLTEKSLGLFTGGNQSMWLIVGGIILLLIGLIAIFPYLGLSRYQIVGILKGKFAAKQQATSNFSFKNSLVIFQFVIAIGLIMATLIIQHQVNFLNQKDLGLHAEQVMVIPIRDGQVQRNYEAVKNTLLSQAGVSKVSAISNFPWEGGFYDFPTTITGNGINQKINFPTLLVDEDFLNTLEIKMDKGRSFSTTYGTDKSGAFILNESAIKQLNLAETEALKVSMDGVQSNGLKEGQIIGVAKNFHLKSLHNTIEPLMLTIAPESYYLDNFVVRVETENLPATLAQLSKNWAKVVPNRPFEYFFLDEAFQRLYQKEARMSTIFQYFTLMALFIAFLGLLALSALSAQQRIKEVGIRKVLGASVAGIIRLLSIDFLKLVMVALLIVSPIVWYWMNHWLDNFAYRIDIQWWMFALAGGLTALIAGVTVGFQALKAALVNPVHSLKNE